MRVVFVVLLVLCSGCRAVRGNSYDTMVSALEKVSNVVGDSTLTDLAGILGDSKSVLESSFSNAFTTDQIQNMWEHSQNSTSVRLAFEKAQEMGSLVSKQLDAPMACLSGEKECSLFGTISQSLSTILHSIHEQTTTTTTTTHGSRPAAPMTNSLSGVGRFLSGHVTSHAFTSHLGEGYIELANRLFFWISIVFLYISRTQEAVGADEHVDMTVAGQRARKWNVVFAVTPTFKEWTESLEASTDIGTYIHDMCDLPYPDHRIPGKGVGVGWSDATMMDPSRVWLEKKPEEELGHIRLPQVLASINANEALLKSCWDQRQLQYNRENPMMTSYKTNIPKLLVAFFCVTNIITPLGSRTLFCPTLSTGENIRVQCTDGTQIGSTCVATCPKFDSEINWGTSTATGNVIVCSGTGEWIGKLVECRQNSDFTYD